MLDIQKDLIHKIGSEYEDYLCELETKSKQEIISESEQTTFYAHLHHYITEKSLTEREIYFLGKDNSLKKIYFCYLSNDYNYLDELTNYGRIIYQFTKEQARNQIEM